MSRPAMASPLTNFEAPSSEPKKVVSSCSIRRRSRASAWEMAPAAMSLSMASCLPGMPSSAKRAPTSAMRPAPLVMTMKLTMSSTPKTTRPRKTEPPMMNMAKPSITWPGRLGAGVALADDELGRGDVEREPQHQRGEEDRREGGEVERPLDEERDGEDEDGDGEGGREPEVEDPGRHRQDHHGDDRHERHGEEHGRLVEGAQAQVHQKRLPGGPESSGWPSVRSGVPGARSAPAAGTKSAPAMPPGGRRRRRAGGADALGHGAPLRLAPRLARGEACLRLGDGDQRLGVGQRPRLELGQQAVEAGAVLDGEFRGQRVVGSSRLRPAAALLVEGAQELCGVGRGPFGIEHVLERGEGVAVPAVVDLHAADVEALAPRGQALLAEGERLVAGLEPVALALAVDRPGPGAHPAVPVLAGLGQRHGEEHLDRHAAAAGALDDGGVAEGGRVRLRRAPRRARAGRPRGPPARARGRARGRTGASFQGFSSDRLGGSSGRRVTRWLAAGRSAVRAGRFAALTAVCGMHRACTTYAQRIC